ncbi:MAG: hypothetical protein LW884_06940 [Bacteroidetes bacterium]|jgi:hypothetical protein|nr:hypothetical protein [Bacteroidota bacterium]
MQANPNTNTQSTDLDHAFRTLSTKLHSLGCVFVDHYNGQPERSVDHVYSWPAAFIEFQALRWEQPRGRIVTAQGSLSLHLIQQHLGDSYTTAQGTQAGRPRFALVEQVQRGLHNWKPEGFGYLLLAGTQPARLWNQLLADVLSYRFEYRRCL